MSTEVAVTTAAPLAIAPNQEGFTEGQLAGLRTLGIDGAPEGEIALFFHQCKKTGLDPFSKQIYMIGRRTKVKVWNEKTRQQDEQWVMKYTIQTGIDGYRLNGKRTARREGVRYSVSDPMWRGQTGDWDDIWLDADNPPAAAKVSIIVDGDVFTGIAMFSEYVQTYPAGGKQVPNSMWAKMPANQLAKCAESAAWRKAFPDDFSGILLEDTMSAGEVIDEAGHPTGKRTVGRGNAGVRAALGITEKSEPVEEKAPVDVSSATVVEHQAPAETTPEPPSAQKDSTPEAKPATRVQVNALTKLFARDKFDTWSDQIEWLANNNLVGDRKITGLADLTTGEASNAINALQ